MLHKNASLGSRHAIHNWAPADAAALAAIVPVAGDDGKVALQLDTGDLWALVDYTGPTWIALTIQAADAPVQSVNGATGVVVLDAGDIAFTPAGGIAATDVQAAILEVQTDNLQSFIVACSDETTAIIAGASKVTFRMPYAFTVTAVAASLTTAQTSGSIFTVDINESAVSILSTKITIDNTEKTSTTAVAPPVISDASIAADAEITIDVDQIGDSTAKGLKVSIIGYRTP